MAESLKRKTVKGTLWSVLERFSVQSVNFVVMIIMARILTKADYGLIGMLAIFIEVSQSLVDSGFSQALVRKQDRTDTDNSTAFYFNIAVGGILYLALFLSAPVIADFYDQPQLTLLTRVVGINILINSFVVVQRALLLARLDFKTQAKASFAASVVAGVAGIAMAYSGFGVWAIVWYQIANHFINVVLLWIVTRWRPLLTFSTSSFRTLFSFGSKLALSGLIDTFYRNLFTLVIGKRFSAAEVGVYTRASQFGSYLSSNVSGVLQRVSYPVLCTIQDDDNAVREAYRKFLRISAFIIFPLMTGLAGVASPLVLILLTDEWMQVIPLLQVLCLALMWYPVHAINLNLLQVKGRSDLFLRLEVIKKIIGVSLLFAALPFGVIAICWSQVASSLISLAINTYYTGRLIDLGFFRQMRELLPALLYSLSMGLCVLGVVSLFSSLWLQLCCGIAAGLVMFFGMAKLTGSADLKEVLSLLKRKR